MSLRYRVHPKDVPPIPDFPEVVQQEEAGDMKPIGLWYSIGERDWWDWCAENAPDWIEDCVISPIHVNLNKILVLDSLDRILQFTRRYHQPILEGISRIFHLRWAEVAAEHDGIEIHLPPRIELLTNRELFWLSTWDVSSGCVWRRSCLSLTP